MRMVTRKLPGAPARRGCARPPSGHASTMTTQERDAALAFVQAKPGLACALYAYDARRARGAPGDAAKALAVAVLTWLILSPLAWLFGLPENEVLAGSLIGGLTAAVAVIAFALLRDRDVPRVEGAGLYGLLDASGTLKPESADVVAVMGAALGPGAQRGTRRGRRSARSPRPRGAASARAALTLAGRHRRVHPGERPAPCGRAASPPSRPPQGSSVIVSSLGSPSLSPGRSTAVNVPRAPA